MLRSAVMGRGTAHGAGGTLHAPVQSVHQRRAFKALVECHVDNDEAGVAVERDALQNKLRLLIS